MELSTHELGLNPGEQAMLTATPYRVEKSGATVVAGDVAIGFELPAGLKATPSFGQGALTAVIEPVENAEGGDLSLTVTGSVGGATMRDTVLVRLGGGDYDLEFF
jgi:hypothetical protein